MDAESAHQTSIAPSYRFLYGENPLVPLSSFQHSITDRGIAYVGANTGFLPAKPPAPLPKPFEGWELAARSLPEVCKLDSWTQFIDEFPDISCHNLSDDHLPLANVCLGAAAHAIARIGFLEVPDKIMTPWRDIAALLGTTSPSLPYLHMVIFNFKFRPFSSDPCYQQSDSELPSFPSMRQLTDPWAQTEPIVTLTGSTTEINFWRGTFNVEYAACSLPGIVARVQQSVVSADNTSLRKGLIELTKTLEKISTAFLQVDCRPFSRKFMDQVEFARIIDAAAQPVVEGENVASGTQSPTIHLLDALFASNARDNRLTKSIQDEMDYFPKIHIEFLQFVREVSTLEYIESLQTSQDKCELMHIYLRALDAFAGDSGFLGVHLRRLYGYTEVGIKVGRVRSASGLPFSQWKGHSWYHVDRAMRQSRAERMDRCQTLFHPVNIRSCTQDGTDDGGTILNIETNGTLVYQAGDVVAVLPENNDGIIRDIMRVLMVEISDHVSLHSNSWAQALADRGLNHLFVSKSEAKTFNVPVAEFLRYAALQPMTQELLRRLVASSSSTIVPELQSIESHQRIYLPTILQYIIKMEECDARTFLPKLASIVEPLAPRYYSVASNMNETPNSIELIIGRVQYEEESLHPLLGSLILNEPGKTSFEAMEVSEEAQKLFVAISHNNIVSASSNDMPTNRLLPPSMDQVTKRCNEKSVRKERVLNGVSSSFLASRAPGDIVRARVIAEHRFRIPEDIDTPIVMISLGTGVAPFVSFLKELIHQKQLGMTKRKAWLILGMKTPTNIPFLKDIEEAVCKHKVAKLSIAFSREDISCEDEGDSEKLVFRPGSRMHVQDLFRNNTERLATLWNMIENGAHVYTCGKPDLVPFVRDTICQASQLFGASVLRYLFNDSETILAKLSLRFFNLFAAQDRLHISSYNSGKKKVLADQFTISEIARHRTMSSALFIFEGSVYDFTNFLQLHPGGAKIMLDKAGRDMTPDFNVAHGRDALPVTAMMEPYRIGNVHQFAGSCCRMKAFMNNWSIPLLHEILEHRSVFMIDQNDFPELETGDHAIWKSQISSRSGLLLLTDKFFSSHESGLFEALIASVSAERLGEALRAMDPRLPITVNWESLEDDITAAREDIVERAKAETEMTKEDATAFLLQARNFLDSVVDSIIEMQREVEKYVRLSTEKSVYDRRELLARAVVDSMRKSVLDSYKRLPMKKNFGK